MIGQIDTRSIPIRDIVVATRLRKHPELIEALAEDIVDHGLINPITVMDSGSGGFTLIAGLRRLEAMKFLGVDDIRASVLSPMDADALLAMEYAENEQRQDFTVSERLEYAEKIKVVEREKARARKSIYARDGHDQDRVVRPDPDRGPGTSTDKGRSRDAIAKLVGISSGVQLRRAMVVAEKRPELLKKIDNGETTIFGAYKEVTTPQPSMPLGSTEHEHSTHAASSNARDNVARAKHDRLMKNPLYADLHAKHIEAVKGMNTARGELRFQVEGLQKVIRGHEENIQALIRERDALRDENRALRQRLGLSDTISTIIADEIEEENHHG